MGGEAVSLPRFLSVFGQLCSALAYLHAQGSVHGAIEPSNLMLDAQGTLKLIDFGAVRQLARGQKRRRMDPEDASEYLAPEVLAGQTPTPAAGFPAGPWLPPTRDPRPGRPDADLATPDPAAAEPAPGGETAPQRGCCRQSSPHSAGSSAAGSSGAALGRSGSRVATHHVIPLQNPRF
ncbi:MAG: protein kinase family protein [Acidimicrobiia bacterium]|nr:protein kinase family protein [Acidimicrobiia bacterium]